VNPLLRIVFGLDSLNVGGTELNAVRTLERLRRDRFDARLVVLRREGALLPRCVESGIPVFELSIGGLASARTARRAIALFHWLRRERVDVVHTHDVYTNVVMAPVARLAGTSLVIASRRWWFTAPRPELIRANKLAYRAAHRVLANSPSVARLVQQSDGVGAERVVTVPNFVDDDAFQPLPDDVAARLRGHWGIAPGVRTVGIVARLDPVKRHVDLLRAFASLLRNPRIEDRWRLVLVGDGPERAAIQAEMRRLGIERDVVVAGQVAHLPGLQSLFDLAVLSSEAEGFPNSIVEAMAAGRPVVATDVGGVSDCVVPGITGLLVPPRDPDALAGAMEPVMANRELAARLGDAGRRRARATFHANVVIAQLEAIYATAARSGSAPRLPTGVEPGRYQI
jgi:glycosyltransferase involved in cell wall biosynthesis